MKRPRPTKAFKVWDAVVKCSVCAGARGCIGDSWVGNQCTGYGGSYQRRFIPCEHCHGTGVETPAAPAPAEGEG